MNNVTYSIAKEYSREPGPRYTWQGTFSGEHFRETVLLTLFDGIVDNDALLTIDLDRTAGFGPSFLEEAFGGLVRLRGYDKVRRHLGFVSREEPHLIGEVNEYMTDAASEMA